MRLACYVVMMMLTTALRRGRFRAVSGGGYNEVKRAAAYSTSINYSSSTGNTSNSGVYVKTYLSIGSNVGDRLASISEALRQMKKLGVLRQTSFLYETPPMYHTDQSNFLNAACLLETQLAPEDLLAGLKLIEEAVGRKTTFRNGPRAIDLDIVLYGGATVRAASPAPLTIPHERMQDRAFVLRPLCDIDPQLRHPLLQVTVHELLQRLPPSEVAGIRRVLPLGRGAGGGEQRLFGEEGVVVCGILNITPDSFSDGGMHIDLQDAVAAAIKMVTEGADVIDVGGESTRPGAAAVAEEEQERRVVPVIKAMRAAGIRAVVSIDTRSSRVARAAVAAGADVINDVSGGAYDGNMIHTAAELGVPIVIMHMRGSPQTMALSENCMYADVVADVANELQHALLIADECGVPRWAQIADPGIGFSKTSADSAALLRPSNVARLRSLLANRALLVGASRKRVVRESVLGARESVLGASIDGSGSVDNEVLDRATAGVCCGAVAGGASIVRVHNCAVVVPAVRALKFVMREEGTTDQNKI